MSEYTFNTDYESIVSLEQPQAEILAKWCRGTLNPNKVIDLGCGPGLYVHELLKLGINAIGYELDPRANNYEHVIHKNLLEVEDTGDVVYCIEVAEHIEPKYSQDIVNKIYDTLEPGGTLIWCAAHLGQGGTDHINCRPIEYWQKKFISKGLIRLHGLEESLKSTITGLIPHDHMGWFIINLMIFYKEDFKDNPSTAGSLIGPNQK